jgi:hypothetical protein
MKKSLISLVIAMLVLGTAAGASYAFFFDRTQVKGMSISTGNADLKIGDKENSDCEGLEDGFCDAITYTELPLDNVYPGFMVGDKFRLKNVSQSDIDLMVQATLQSYSGNWNKLKDKIYGAVIEYELEDDAQEDIQDNIPGNIEGNLVTNTGWQTMDWWSTNNPEIITEPLTSEEEGGRHLVLWIKVDENAGNEIKGLGVDLDLEFTGTQVTE